MVEDTLSLRATAFLKTISENASPHGTIGRRDTPPRERHEAFLRGLSELPKGTTSLHLGDTLGQGGMGLVRSAIQRSVSREVAVKSLRPPTAAEVRARGGDLPLSLPEGSERLLEEAWVTGAIEHPNVVPIYDILRAEDGGPMIVMRRIAGSSWANALADQETRTRLGDDAWLESQLRTLLQVTNAISAAHAQGIVHRDLKPENVMLGQYGEVYVVDWGIAVLVEPSMHAHLPILSADASVVGTPVYMAPEMLAGEATRATDVYLLGAMAFEVATGAPPHDKKTMGEAVLSILESPPPMPASIDAGLAEILRKALALDPTSRFSSAKAFAEAIEHYLMTRASVQTAQLGMKELDELDLSLRDGKATPASVEALFGAARFSFQAALRQWNDNDVAKLGLVRTYLATASFALKNDDPERALTLLHSVPGMGSDNAELRALAATAEKAVASRRARLDALARHGDLESGTSTRSFIASCVTALWFAMSLASWWHYRTTGHAFPRELVYVSAMQLVLWTGLTTWARESLHKTEFNKKIVRIGFAIPIFLGALGLVLEFAGFSETQIFQIGLVTFCSLLISLVVFVGEVIFYLATLAICVAAAVIVLRPEWRYVGFLGTLGVALSASLGAFAKSSLAKQKPRDR